MLNQGHAIYPYSWNADRIAVVLRDGREAIGLRLSNCFFSESVYLRTNPFTVLGFPVADIESIRVWKRDRWYAVPVQWRRPKA